ncbi:hypothetical protein ABTZ99_30575 [Actinosynnema sp. NPDC002837]
MGDFDFLIGRWSIHNRRLRRRLVGSDDWEEFASSSDVRPIFGGAGNVDEITFPDGTSGLTVRLFDPATGRWSLNWASSDSGVFFPPLFGSFADGVGTFHGDEVQDGVPVRIRFLWHRVTGDSARWEQAMSADGGRTWETNWYMDITRRA